MFGPNFPIPSDTVLACLSASQPTQLLAQTDWRQQIPVIFCTFKVSAGAVVPVDNCSKWHSLKLGPACPLIASAVIFGTLLHALVEIGRQLWSDKHEKTLRELGLATNSKSCCNCMRLKQWHLCTSYLNNLLLFSFELPTTIGESWQTWKSVVHT